MKVRSYERKNTISAKIAVQKFKGNVYLKLVETIANTDILEFNQQHLSSMCHKPAADKFAHSRNVTLGKTKNFSVNCLRICILC